MKQKTILIVEDDAAFARTLAQALKLDSEVSYQVTTCYSAEEAYQQLDKSRYDLLVSDYRLPGEDGLSLINNARANDPEMQVVLITGVGSRELEKQTNEVGQGYLTKPFDMLDLLLLVKQALEKSEQPAEISDSASLENGGDCCRVLILEDEAGLRRLYTLALLKSGCYQIDEAATIGKARELLNTRDYDILISDVRIGRDRATELLDEYSEVLNQSGTRVVMCSAFGQYRNLSPNVDRFLEKPISLERLVNVVDQLANIRPNSRCG